MNITAFDVAQRFIGMKEVPGTTSNPAILAMLRLDDAWPATEDVPWCSAFMNYVCWLLRLPRSKSLAARSWLNVGTPVRIDMARPGFDVVILSRPPNSWSGHVGFYAGWIQGEGIAILGGNQNNSVSVDGFDPSRILGIRRLA